jgi:hypothetical protein
MGREADAHVDIDGDSSRVRAILEADELIVRGAMRRRFARSAITDARVEGGALLFTYAHEEHVSLHLGPQVAPRWLVALHTPPPSLQHKLGLADPASRAYVIGEIDDAALAQALAGRTTPTLQVATSVIAIVSTEGELSATVRIHARHPTAPLWIVHRKGRSATFGANSVRDMLRASGYHDTKVCSVSERYTASRYNSH